jgi:hypothetical protein
MMRDWLCAKHGIELPTGEFQGHQPKPMYIKINPDDLETPAIIQQALFFWIFVDQLSFENTVDFQPHLTYTEGSKKDFTQFHCALVLPSTLPLAVAQPRVFTPVTYKVDSQQHIVIVEASDAATLKIIRQFCLMIREIFAG